ncbi:MAG TPA: RNA polymerase sigma factor, partial [Gammaproteobacteria bacterium]
MPNPSPVPVETLERAKRGDRSAHAELYAAFGGPVFTLARRMLASRALAEDVLQETFVEVICNIDRFRGDAEVGTWIKRIAINKCLMHVRSS